MKKFASIILSLICLLGMVSCNGRDMDDIVKNEPNITGIVKEIYDKSILIENESGEYFVSLKMENKDSITHFSVDDEVVVYYDGNIAETYPMQINTVYAITLRTPADHSDHDI